MIMYEVDFYELEGNLEIRRVESSDLGCGSVYNFCDNRGSEICATRETPKEAVDAIIDYYRKQLNDLFEKHRFYELCIDRIGGQKVMHGIG